MTSQTLINAYFYLSVTLFGCLFITIWALMNQIGYCNYQFSQTVRSICDGLSAMLSEVFGETEDEG